MSHTHQCECGHEWEHGQSGTHHCSSGYKSKIKSLQAKLLKAEARNAELKTKFNSMANHFGFDDRSELVAEIQAKAIEVAVESTAERGTMGVVCYENDLIEYAESLRANASADLDKEG